MLDYETYRDNNESHPYHPSVRMRNNFVLRTLRMLLPKTILDAGCGDGFLVWLLLHQYPAWDVTISGMDYSAKVVELNKTKFPKTQFSHGDLGVPLSVSNQYDVVICSEVIEHIENRKQVITNLAWLTAQQGYVILTTQSGKRYESDLINGHIKHFTLEELEGEFANHGLKPVFSYKKWFPRYDLQKMVHSTFMSWARSIQYGEITRRKKMIFSLVYRMFEFTPQSRSLWTQIYMLLQKK